MTCSEEAKTQTTAKHPGLLRCTAWCTNVRSLVRVENHVRSSTQWKLNVNTGKRRLEKSFIHEVDLRWHWPLLYWIVVPEERYFTALERVAPFVRRRSYRAGKCTPEQTRHHMRCDGKAVAWRLAQWKKKEPKPTLGTFSIRRRKRGRRWAVMAQVFSWCAHTSRAGMTMHTRGCDQKDFFFIFACANTFRSLCFICSAYYWPHYTV